MDKKKISVIIPCRNEILFIRKCMESLRNMDPVDTELEILVIDGMSSDGTREVLDEFRKKMPYLKVFDNEVMVTPVALNLGIKAASGEIIVRMDAHSEYPSYFIKNALESLDKHDADVIGGPIETVSRSGSILANAIALLTSCKFGVGNSNFRTSKKEGYVDTVPFGVYRKEVFAKFGMFNEKLTRNQDNELSSRIIAGGGRIYMTPKLTAYYFNQETFAGLLSQAFRAGRWNVKTLLINKDALFVRHFVPFAFVAATIVLVLAGLFSDQALYLLAAMWTLYFLLASYFSVTIAVEKGLVYLLLLPWMFLFYHLTYGAGSLYELLGTVSGFMNRKRS